jgi:hypothetical protein
MVVPAVAAVSPRADLVTRYRRNIDDMSGFLLLHVRQCRPYSVKHTFDVHIDRLVPVVDLEALQWRMRHQSGVVEHDVDPSIGLDRCIDEAFYLIEDSHVRADGECSAALPFNSPARDSMQSTRRAASTTAAPGVESTRAVASPYPLLAPVITTILPSIF